MGALPFNLACLGCLPQKKIEISSSEKCILVDPGDGFAMDNGESKNPFRSDRGICPLPPLDPPLQTVTLIFYTQF